MLSAVERLGKKPKNFVGGVSVETIRDNVLDMVAAGHTRGLPVVTHDRLHASAGAYYDLLVTEDKPFREALLLVPDVPFEVLTPRELIERL